MLLKFNFIKYKGIKYLKNQIFLEKNFDPGNNYFI